MRIDGQSFAPSQPAGTAFDAIIQNNVSAAQNMPFRLVGGGEPSQVVDYVPSREISANTLTVLAKTTEGGQRPQISMTNIAGGAVGGRPQGLHSDRIKLNFDRGLYAHQDPITLNNQPAIRIGISESQAAFEAHPERKVSDITQAESLNGQFQLSAGEHPMTVLDEGRAITNDRNTPIEVALWDDVIAEGMFNQSPAQFNFQRTSVAADAFPHNFLSLTKDEQLQYWNGMRAAEKSMWTMIYLPQYFADPTSPRSQAIARTALNLGIFQMQGTSSAQQPGR